MSCLSVLLLTAFLLSAAQMHASLKGEVDILSSK